MKSRASRSFLVWLLAMLAGVVVVWHSRFSADMSFFLPSRPTAEQQVLVDQLKDSALSRLLMLAVEGGTAPQRAALSRDLRQRLAGRPEFVAVQNGEADSQQADREFLLKYRYLLSPTVTPERFTTTGLQAAVANSIDLLASPLGMLLKPLLPRDPTGELVELLSHLDSGAQPNSNLGVWASRDGERAMLLVLTRAQGSDTDGQEAAIATVRREFAASVAANGLDSTRLQLSGPGLFAVKSRATIKEEVSRLSLISTLAIIGVLLFVYRSLRLLGLGLLPVISGALAGIVAVSLAYGTVFGITVGFGSALIGEAVDYSIYYFVQSGQGGLAAWRQRFWPTVRLGVLTSVCGFGALLFSGFPGLAQLGLYSLSGVLTAALVTRFVLPPLTGPASGMRDLAPLGRRLQRVIHALHRLRGPVLVIGLLAALTLFARGGSLWDSELSALSSLSPADQALDAALRADIGGPDTGILVVLSRPQREEALQAAERSGQLLDRLVGRGLLGGYDSPARFLPSLAAQAVRRSSLPSVPELRQRLPEALRDSPLAAGKLEPFLADIDAARQLPDIDRATLNGTSLALAVDSLLLPGGAGWTVLLPLHPGSQPIDLAGLRSELAGSGALVIDLKGEFNKLYNDYLHEAILLSLAGVAAIVALLGATLRSAGRLARVLLPLVLAVLMVIAGLHLLGERLHLLHLVGMLLIVAVGSNYALFFDQARGTPLDPKTLASMLIANLTTAIGFGTLALSSVPVLHAVGATVGPGAMLALLLSAIFVPRETGA
ncbi:MAG: MMPL family transporter [Bacteroidota bacterium]